MSQRIERLADGVTCYLGDCLEILPTLSKDFAVVSDPPYGIGYVHSGGGRSRTARKPNSHVNIRGCHPIVGDDKPFDPGPLLAFDEVIIFGSDHFYPRLPDSGRWLAWNKLGDLAPWDSFSDVEFAWHSREAPARIFSMKWKGMVMDRRGGEEPLREHVTQKPIRLMKWAIGQLKSAAPILDPFMGSGTTGVAAVSLGRKFTGVEIEPKYFDIACRRISEALKQGDMFVEKPASAAPKQESFL